MPNFGRHAQQRTARALKAEAARLGFDACGISTAEPLDEEARRLEQWLLEGRHGTMHWMERHFDKRIDPTRLVPGAESVISVLHNYYQPDTQHDESATTGKISRYAWGDDYHDVLKERLYLLLHWLEEHVGQSVHGRAFVDSAPVLDKAWAARSGLGWQGKHSNLLNREMGSFFFIGEIIVDVPMPADHPVEDFCGSCTRCVDACPTDAIYQPYAVDATRCISYLTIEHGGDDVPEAISSDMQNWIFGCDICQDVCPWNKFKQPTNEPRYQPREGMSDTDLRDWVELELEEFRERFSGSPVTRATYEGFQRNVRTALKNVTDDA
ncbi:MAG: tRNA epoxyqueuosine(34) reductase QueG [Longimonas sp.]|uniref:tRNA epoxyqueuosine(34) reductase QueG n=1 Tax=Longimonas sp. TaxID=2039626 RepID=UPI003974CF5F